jgi:hypothetical protein
VGARFGTWRVYVGRGGFHGEHVKDGTLVLGGQGEEGDVVGTRGLSQDFAHPATPSGTRGSEG